MMRAPALSALALIAATTGAQAQGPTLADRYLTCARNAYAMQIINWPNGVALDENMAAEGALSACQSEERILLSIGTQNPYWPATIASLRLRIKHQIITESHVELPR